MSTPGEFPRFLDEWREINGPDFTPLSYLNQEDGIPFVIAAQWLYAPHFFEYRGAIFRSVRPEGRSEKGLRTLDGWFDYFDGDIPKVERNGNTLTLWDFFVGIDIDKYDADLSGMANTLARVWGALLRVEFPDRNFRVRVFDADEYGPQVTFHSEELASGPDGEVN
jgi:hypothetical protein